PSLFILSEVFGVNSVCRNIAKGSVNHFANAASPLFLVGDIALQVTFKMMLKRRRPAGAELVDWQPGLRLPGKSNCTRTLRCVMIQKRAIDIKKDRRHPTSARHPSQSMIHNYGFRRDTGRHIMTVAHSFCAVSLAYMPSSGDTSRHWVTRLDRPKRYPQSLRGNAWASA